MKKLALGFVLMTGVAFADPTYTKDQNGDTFRTEKVNDVQVEIENLAREIAQHQNLQKFHQDQANSEQAIVIKLQAQLNILNAVK